MIEITSSSEGRLELKPDLTQACSLLNFATENVGEVTEIIRSGRRIDYSNPEDVTNKFKKAVTELGNSDISFGEQTHEKVALFLLRILHQEEKDTFNFIERKYSSVEMLTCVIEKQLKVTGGLNDAKTLFFRDLLSKLKGDHPGSISREDLSDVTGPCLVEILNTATFDNISTIAAIACTEKFARNNPEASLRFVGKISELLEVSMERGNFDNLTSLIKLIGPQKFDVVLESLGEKLSDQVALMLSKINEILLPDNLDCVFSHPELATRVFEWQLYFQNHFDSEAVNRSLQRGMDIITQLLADERLQTEPSVSFSLLNSCLGYTLNTLTDSSVLINEYAARNVSDFECPDVYIKWLNLKKMFPVIDLAMQTLIEMKDSCSDSESIPFSFRIDGKTTIGYLIEQSPDILNYFKSHEVRNFATAFLDPQGLLKNIKKTTDKWVKFIDDVFSSNATVEQKQGAQFLLNRIYCMLFVSHEEREKVSAKNIEQFSCKINNSLGNLQDEWTSEISPMIKSTVTETLLIPSAEQIAGQLYSDGESSQSFIQDFLLLLKSTTVENQSDITTWMLSVTKDCAKKPEILQVLSGIICSPSIASEEKIRILNMLRKDSCPRAVLGSLVEKITAQLVRQRMIESQIKNMGLPNDWERLYVKS